MTAQTRLLEEELDEAKRIQNYRVEAEVCFALAQLWEREHDYQRAKDYACESLRAIRLCPSETLEDVASARLDVGGIPLPDLFHEGVVQSRLAHLLGEDSTFR